MSGPTKCVILVPANYGIEPECERGLVQLERRGYPVWRVPGFAAIDQCRNQVATDALARGSEELFWIDADIAFEPDAVDRLRGHNLPIVAALYPKKSMRALASRLFSTTKEIVLGAGGGLIEIRYAAGGFLYTRREVYEAIQRHGNLPVCNEQVGKRMVPYFMPMVVEDSQGLGDRDQGLAGTEAAWVETHATVAAAHSPTHHSPTHHSPTHHSPTATPHIYLAEDFSFSHRARAAGFKIFADTTIRLGHIGRYAYSWEDAGGSNQRFGTYIYRVLDAEGGDR
jgi:hypothetical protein